MLNFTNSKAMDLAMSAVQNGGMSVNCASKTYNVPYSSLWEKLKGIRRNKLGTHRRKFTDREEDYLADIILRCADIGISLNRKIFQRLVPQLAAEKGFTGRGGYFSERWQRNFLKRHPDVSERFSDARKSKKSREKTTTCDGWVELLSELHMDGYLTDPEGIWNLDETAFNVTEKVSIVYPRHGMKDDLSYSDGMDQKLITVLAGGSAAGTILRPLMFSDGRVFVSDLDEPVERSCLAGVVRSDVMDNATFTNYIKQEIIPAMTAEKNVIFLDPHSSHVANYELLVACATSEKNIKVIRFPSEQTNRLQRKDVKVFGPVKKSWAEFLREEIPFSLGVISKQNFMEILMSKWDETDLERSIRCGFEAAGIYPFIPEAICKGFVAPEPKPKSAVKREIISTKDLYASQLDNLRTFLRANFLALMEREIDDIVNFTVLKLEGFKPTVTVPDLFKSVGSNLPVSRPPKRKRKTDTRLQAENGTGQEVAE